MINDTLTTWGMENGEENRNVVINPSAPVFVIDGVGGNNYQMYFTDSKFYFKRHQCIFRCL